MPTPCTIPMTHIDKLRMSEANGGIRFEVRAKPRAKKSRIAGVREGSLEVSVHAPPVDGAANAAIIEALADALGVPKRDVSLVRGDSARAKLFEVVGVTEAEARARFARVIAMEAS